MWYTRNAYIWTRWIAPAAAVRIVHGATQRCYACTIVAYLDRKREEERVLHLFSHTGLRAGAARTSPTDLESTAGLALRPWTPSLYSAGRSARPFYPTGAHVAHMLPGRGG